MGKILKSEHIDEGHFLFHYKCQCSGKFKASGAHAYRRVGFDCPYCGTQIIGTYSILPVKAPFNFQIWWSKRKPRPKQEEMAMFLEKNDYFTVIDKEEMEDYDDEEAK